MQISLWSRDTLERLVKDLIEENKRLTRVNWGRAIGIIFFAGWLCTVCVYLTSPNPNMKSCKNLQMEKHLKK